MIATHRNEKRMMSDTGQTSRRWMALLLVLLYIAIPTAVSAKRETVTIACDWDFAPYEFRSNKGQNEGYCVEVLSNILKDLDIPHKFVMSSRQNAIDSFRHKKVDLIIDYGKRFEGENYCRSVSVLGYNNLMMARNRKAQEVSKMDQIEGKTIAVNVINDSVPKDIIKSFMERCKLMEYSGREALGELESGKLEYFIGVKEQLEWKIRELNLQNIVIDSLDIEPKEIHIVGYDQQLITDIDNQYARLQQSGRVNLIRERWLFPERAARRNSPIAWYIVLAVLLIALVVLVIYRIILIRVRKVLHRNSVTEAMMRQALNMGNFFVITNNLRRNLVTNQHGNILPEEGLTMQQMMKHIHPDDRKAMVMRRDVLRKLKGRPYPYRMRWNYGTDENPVWHTVAGFSYPESGHLPIPKNIVIIARDITEELRQEQENKELTNRYMKMFDSSLVAMSFYDKEGNLINLNENMKKLIGLNDESLKFFWSTKIFDTETFRDNLDPSIAEHFHTCSRMYFPALGIDKYVEQRVRYIFDEDGKLIFYAVTARDVTDERNMYLEMQRQREALDKTSKAKRHYERDLRTLLENSNMYVWKASMKTRDIAFSRSLHGETLHMTIDEYFDNIDEAEREQAMKTFQDLTRVASMADSKDINFKPFNITHMLQHTPVTQTRAWFTVSGVPLPGADGKVRELFGVVRNVTTLMEAQQRLREETLRAENSAMLKSTFLANMTHEIRTPLNAIVGFSDLLQSITDANERNEFISIIHNNCDMLMRLINDIFEASTLDVKPLAIVPHRVDFAQEFIVVSQSLEQRVQEPGVKFIVESPVDSFVTIIDMGRIQQVITNFVTNAVKYTHQGHIRVGWKTTKRQLPNGEEEADGIYIYCEDSGTGIPKEKQKLVFERFYKLNDFVQGTGLGLAICKSIAQGYGGQIGVESEGEGKGSTFWIWIPCKEITTATA